MGKKDRPLTPDELTLWRETIGEGQTAGDAAVSGQSSPLPPIPSANTPKGKSSGPNPGGLGKHEARAIKRGRLPIDDRIDLHGMTQDLARDALSGFIRNSAAQGLKCVLVINHLFLILKKQLMSTIIVYEIFRKILVVQYIWNMYLRNLM